MRFNWNFDMNFSLYAEMVTHFFLNRCVSLRLSSCVTCTDSHHFCWTRDQNWFYIGLIAYALSPFPLQPFLVFEFLKVIESISVDARKMPEIRVWSNYSVKWFHAQKCGDRIWERQEKCENNCNAETAMMDFRTLLTFFFSREKVFQAKNWVL